MTRIMRSTWAVLIWLVLIMIPIQFYLAGHGAFEFHATTESARESAWDPHGIFGTVIGVAVLLSLIAALAARLPRPLLLLSVGLFVDTVVQILLPGFGDDASTRWIAALHPVNALVLTGLTINLAIRSRQYLPFRAAQGAEDPDLVGAGT